MSHFRVERRNREVKQFAKVHTAGKGAGSEFEFRTDIIQSLCLEHSSCFLEFTLRKCGEESLFNHMHLSWWLLLRREVNPGEGWGHLDVFVTFHFFKEEKRCIANSATC